MTPTNPSTMGLRPWFSGPNSALSNISSSPMRTRFFGAGAKLIAAGAFAALFCALLAAAAAPAARAAGSANGCVLTRNQLAELQAAQNDADYSGQINRELAVRKRLLSQIIDCSAAEAENFRARVNKAAANDEDAKRIRAQLADQLGNAVNYYGIQKSKIDDLGLQGSKNFARDLKAWRAGNYELNAKRASNFTIWADNQALFETAKNRMNQIGQSVALLKIVENQKIQNAWDEAVADFDEALKANDSAKQIFLAFGSPEDSLAGIKSSLESLSATYQKFSDTISAINKALRPQ